MKRRAWIMAVAMLAASAAAIADEARIRSMVEASLDGAVVEHVQPAPVPGLFEVTVQAPGGPRVLYTDANGDHIFIGTLYDARSQRNLTEERMRTLLAIDFGKLPLDMAVKVRRGNGRRVLAMFSDPYCPACRQFEQELARVDDITVYYFMYPIIRPEMIDHSRAVWCSPDRAKAWIALATHPRAQPPTASPTCDTPVDRILELGKSLHVGSTPTLFLANGERIQGGLHAADLVTLLDQAARETKPK